MAWQGANTDPPWDRLRATGYKGTGWSFSWLVALVAQGLQVRKGSPLLARQLV